jgi:hypothetical protein
LPERETSLSSMILLPHLESASISTSNRSLGVRDPRVICLNCYNQSTAGLSLRSHVCSNWVGKVYISVWADFSGQLGRVVGCVRFVTHLKNGVKLKTLERNVSGDWKTYIGVKVDRLVFD